MLDSLPSPELSYFFKRQLLTHHSCKSRIPANGLRFAGNESPSRVIGSLRIRNTVRIDAEPDIDTYHKLVQTWGRGAQRSCSNSSLEPL